MRALRSVAFGVALALGGIALGAETDAEQILDRFRELRPKDDELLVYRLDWAKDLDAAKARAKKEGRPILLVFVNQISGGGDISTGHC